jgi:hypothetical protein
MWASALAVEAKNMFNECVALHSSLGLVRLPPWLLFPFDDWKEA